MSNLETRSILVDALHSANVEGVAEDSRIDAFLSGDSDIRFDQINMDSLAAMEFCICVELDSGISLAPDDLRTIKTLGSLARMIHAS